MVPVTQSGGITPAFVPDVVSSSRVAASSEAIVGLYSTATRVPAG